MLPTSPPLAQLLALPATSPSAGNDRGIVHQLLTGLHVSSNTAHTVQVLTIGPLRVLVIVVVAFVLSRLVGRLARRLVDSLRLVSPLVRATARGADRARTVGGVLAGIFRAIIWVVAGLAVLEELGIKLAPFVATATVIGAAVAFGAQSLVRDFLSGLLILAEDQYGVGDSIVVGDTTGTVEGVNLRTTRMRSVDGVVWYVPNGDIRKVGNNTASDTCALIDLVVPHGTNLVAAGHAMEDEARMLASDPAWSDVIIGEAAFSGVQTTDHDGATLRLLAPTRAGEQFRVGRELRLRLLERLRHDSLAWSPALPADSPAPAAGSPSPPAGAPSPPAGSPSPPAGSPSPPAGSPSRSEKPADRQPPNLSSPIRRLDGLRRRLGDRLRRPGDRL